MKIDKKIRDKLLISYSTKSKRVGHAKKEIKDSFLDNLFFGMGRIPAIATMHDLYTALALTIRDRIFLQFVQTTDHIAKQDSRAVVFLSAEYLPGPHLANNLLNLNIEKQTREVMEDLNIDLKDLVEIEEEPGLGNGGLGRLASCYIDSMATLGIPSISYGIRYEFGIFNQVIRDGWQMERTDKWLHFGNPWEVVRPEIAYEVKFGGRTEKGVDQNGKFQVNWIPHSEVKGTAYDTPVIGNRGNGSILRLWRAEAIESFDFGAFNLGDYYLAVEKKMISENITKVLYPNDQAAGGKELRLKQQYFFVSCSLQDLIYLHRIQGRRMDRLHEKFAIQLNDTHPAIAIAELMRLLVDEHQMNWDKAWQITRHCFAYTNHTLLPEALEKWPVPLFQSIFPRHLELIYEINHRFLQELRHLYSYTEEQISRMSIIEEKGERYIRMAHLATIGSHKVNGVSTIHSRLLKDQVLRDFAILWPEKFCNVTNGITPRRFLSVCNPLLTDLITEYIGEDWKKDLGNLRKLENFVDDDIFLKKWKEVKFQNKVDLAAFLKRQTGIEVDPTTLFSMQAKRIHEYKRQHLKVLHIISLYLRIKKGQGEDICPTTFLFAGKAAPGYFMAKLIIKLIHSVADLVNQDKEINGRIKVVFLPDLNVKKAQHLYPAADLSEQISLAGMEASGTGNMKFSLNGALTIGTLDGANVEIREEVGEENFFLFGLNVEQVQSKKASGYIPHDFYQHNQHLKEVLDLIVSETISGSTQLFRPLYDHLLYDDPFMLLADFQSYVEAEEQVHKLWLQQKEWTQKSILNTARMGNFSSDRSIRDYCDLIWRVEPIQRA